MNLFRDNDRGENALQQIVIIEMSHLNPERRSLLLRTNYVCESNLWWAIIHTVLCGSSRWLGRAQRIDACAKAEREKIGVYFCKSSTWAVCLRVTMNGQWRCWFTCHGVLLSQVCVSFCIHPFPFTVFIWMGFNRFRKENKTKGCALLVQPHPSWDKVLKQNSFQV